MIHHLNTTKEKAGVSVLISDKANLRARKVIKDKEEHYIPIKGSPPRRYNNFYCVCT